MNKKELTVQTILLSLFAVGILFLFVTIGMNLLATKQVNADLDERLATAQLKLDEIKELNEELKEEVEQIQYEKSRSLYCSLSSVQCNE